MNTVHYGYQTSWEYIRLIFGIATEQQPAYKSARSRLASEKSAKDVGKEASRLMELANAQLLKGLNPSEAGEPGRLRGKVGEK